MEDTKRTESVEAAPEREKSRAILLAVAAVAVGATIACLASWLYRISPLESAIHKSKAEAAQELRREIFEAAARFTIDPPAAVTDRGTHLLSAAEILARVGARYFALETYSDEGILETLLYSSEESYPPITRKLKFSTKFIRAGKFRFEFQTRMSSDWLRYVILADPDRVLRGWDVATGPVEEKSLEQALAAAAGVSHGLSCVVPALLGGLSACDFRLGGLEGLVRSTDEILRSREGRSVYCLRFRGETQAGEVYTFWIDAETFLIHRVERWMRGSERALHSEQVVEFAPKADIRIPDDAFPFEFRNRSDKRTTNK